MRPHNLPTVTFSGSGPLSSLRVSNDCVAAVVGGIEVGRVEGGGALFEIVAAVEDLRRRPVVQIENERAPMDEQTLDRRGEARRRIGADPRHGQTARMPFTSSRQPAQVGRKAARLDSRAVSARHAGPVPHVSFVRGEQIGLSLDPIGRNRVRQVHALHRPVGDVEAARGRTRCRARPRSLPSRPKFVQPNGLSMPRPMMRTNVALSMSSSAIALFSCKVTHAVLESSDTAMYSGSRSCATLAFGPKMRMLGSSAVPLKAVKRAVVTSDCDSVVMTSRQSDDADAAFGIVTRGRIRAGLTFVGDQHARARQA